MARLTKRLGSSSSSGHGPREGSREDDPRWVLDRSQPMVGGNTRGVYRAGGADAGDTPPG